MEPGEGFSGELAGGPQKADRSSFTPGDFGESFGPNQYGDMSPENQAIFDQLRAQEIQSLTLGGLFSRFGKGALGMNPGPFGLSAWGHPAADQLSFAGKALGAIGGPFGMVAGRLARGGAEIATGTNADFGGGFGTALGDPSRGSGMEAAATPETVSGALGQKPQPGAIEMEVGNIEAKKAQLMRDFQTQDQIAEFRQLLAEVQQLRGRMGAR